MIPQQHRKKAGWAAIAVVAVTGFEGVRNTVYLDPIKIPTYCVGETRNPQWGKVYTNDECSSILEGRLVEFYDGVAQCLPEIRSMPDTRAASIVSLSYNIGTGAFCRSTVARLFRAGDVAGACDAFMMWTKAGGITFRGLVKRRESERALCLTSA